MDDLLDLNFGGSSALPGSKKPSPAIQPKPVHLQPTTGSSARSSSPFDDLLKPNGALSSLSGSGASLSWSTSSVPLNKTSSFGGTLGMAQRSSAYSASPSLTSSIGTSRTASPAMSAQPLSQTKNGFGSGDSKASKQTVKVSDDAFSGLLSSVGGSAAASLMNGTAKLSLVEQQQKMEREKREREEREKAAFDFASWGATPSTITRNGSLDKPVAPRSYTTTEKTLADFGVFDDGGSSAPSTSIPRGSVPSTIPSSSDPSRTTSAQPRSSTSKRSQGDIWSLDASAKDLLSSSPPSKKDAPSQSQHDWFDRMAGPSYPNASGSKSHTSPAFGEEDDVLGLLSKPVVSPQPERSPKVDRSSAASTSPVRRRPSPRSRSPPPHIIGRIVEMGFSPSEARQALLDTPSGMDVESAIESLLARQNQSGRGQSSSRLRHTQIPERTTPDVDTAAAEAAERRRRRRQGPSRSTLDQTQEDPSQRDRSDTPLDLRADKLISQASEIGASMFSKANVLWNHGKERAQKLYEERAAALAAEAAKRGGGRGSGTASPANLDGRPRWMVEAEAMQRGHDEAESREPVARARDTGHNRSDKTPRWQDSDDDEPQVPEPATRTRVESSKQDETRRKPPRALPQQNIFDPRDEFADRSSSQLPPEKPRQSGTPPLTRQPQPRRKIRPQTPADRMAVERSIALRERGNETFKLGKFGEAVDLYTSAIEALPSDHLLRIPLYNNRASASLKQGEHASAISDTTRVITMIGQDYQPAKEEPLTGDCADVHLDQALFKAYSKRASAFEMAEKWSKAKEDWEWLIGSPVIASSVFSADIAGANHRKMVSEGLARSRKMLDPSLSSSSVSPVASASKRSSGKPPTSTAKAARAPPIAAQLDRSKGVSEMRAAAAAQEKEDDLRHSLKDGVDAKIMAWSGGKTTNLRALLASLDTVLWDGLQLKKVSMADLITEKQVKIAYMRVIGRLHPDKLKSSDTTVEQKMVANAVFGILNEAWHAFNGGAK